MGKALIGVLVLVLVLLGGYIYFDRFNPSQSAIVTIPPSSSQEPVTITTENTVTDYSFPSISTLEGGFGIRGDTVTIKDLYPGYTDKFQIEILNGKDQTREFRLSVVPESNLQGWEQLPSTCYTWIQISNPAFSLQAGQNQVVPIIISMPSTSTYEGKRARCRILVEDISQTGLVQIAVSSKVYIETFKAD